MDMLNYKQLSDKFPVCPVDESSDMAWASLLHRWRDEGKIKERIHWRYGPGVDSNRPTRYYDVPKVVRLICLEARGKLSRARISFLYQEYFDQFAAILQEANAANAANAEQVIPS